MNIILLLFLLLIFMLLRRKTKPFVIENLKDLNNINILGKELRKCSENPVTGFYRDGYCKTDKNDIGTHTVCSEMTDEFLEFTKSKGNDLSTPNTIYNFPGLKSGDKWCLCEYRWNEAYKAGKAPRVDMSATNIKTKKNIINNIIKNNV